MKKFLSMALAFCIATICFAKSVLPDYEYEITGVAIAKEGYYLVEVTAMVDKKKDANLDTARKCAIHGCLFKGFPVERISQKPIMPPPIPEKEHEEYISRIINEQFNTYTTSNHPIQIVKVGKRFRIKAIIAVAKESLRKDLEKAGIIRKLGL